MLQKKFFFQFALGGGGEGEEASEKISYTCSITTPRAWS